MKEQSALIKVTPENAKVVKSFLFLSSVGMFMFFMSSQVSHRLQWIRLDTGMPNSLDTFLMVMIFIAAGAAIWGIINWLVDSVAKKAVANGK